MLNRTAPLPKGGDGIFPPEGSKLVTVTSTPQKSETEPESVRVIATASKTIVVLAAALAIPATYTAITSPSLLAFVWLVPHIAIVLRVAKLRLSVSASGVMIRNFFSTTVVPIWEAELEIRSGEETVLLSDAGGKLDTEGRILYIKRPWNQSSSDIHVGIAPRFGNEFDRIHNELVGAIRDQRAA
jgi:hypothetical protein